ncbi:MAG: hypothetical protein ACK55Z_12165, partial [bacterium]
RQSGFDLEALLRVKDADKLKAFFQEAFPHLDDADISMMSSNLASVVKTLTSGRLTERIKLNESFEATIKNQKVRLDELYENNVDILYNDYTQEMAGWSALSDRLGIKSRDAWYETSNRIIEDKNTNQIAFVNISNDFIKSGIKINNINLVNNHNCNILSIDYYENKIRFLINGNSNVSNLLDFNLLSTDKNTIVI